ncbi:hypothetical protein ACP70R_030438 [Stipagrostis hirtigluma subsp. patula]
MVVVTRSMTAKRAPLALAHDVVVEIAGAVAASSPRPMDDLCSIRATCKAMYEACNDRAVGRRVALEREAAMKWSETGRYHAVVDHLAGAGNPEACFLVGLTLIFAHRCAPEGAAWLDRAAAAGHKAAAYVLGLLLYGVSECRGVAEQYIRLVEGEAGDVDGGGKCKTNRECVRCRNQALGAVREVTWKMAGPPALAAAALPEDGQRCTVTGCGSTEGWDDSAVFCSDGCRIRHEHAKFFSLVSRQAS